MADVKAGPKRKRFKPWPKMKQTNSKGTPLIDLDRVRQLYLEGPHCDWQPFCNHNGFDGRTNRNKWKARGFDFNNWKVDWFKLQSKQHDVDQLPELFESKKFLCERRIKFIKDWNKRAEYMKVLLDASLRKHGDAIQHDMKYAALISRNEVQAKFTLEADEFNTLGAVALKIQELEQKSLLVFGDKQVHPVIDSETGQVEHVEEIPEFQTATMGTAGMSSAEIGKLLAGFFDQVPDPKQIAESQAEEAKDESSDHQS